MNETSLTVRVFRLIVAALVCFYFFYNFHPSVWTSQLGWSWRFLTTWGQTLSLVVALLMLARSFGYTSQWPDALVSVTVVLNIMIVYLYWNTAGVDSDGTPPVWWRQYYIHGLGPALQWFDAFFIFGCFRRPIRIGVGLISVIALYVLWMELVLEPFTSSPVGTATSGLPYPFLNDMTFNSRIEYYGETILVYGFLAAFVCGLIALLLRRSVGLGKPQNL